MMFPCDSHIPPPCYNHVTLVTTQDGSHSGAVNAPMFAEVVPPKHRTMIYAFDRAFEGIDPLKGSSVREAEALSKGLFDTLIKEAMNGTSVAEIFENFGESVFREKEVLLLHFFFLLTISHIAGGGAVIRPINWKYMRKGISIWLDVPRIAALGTNSRPLLRDDESGGDPYTVALTRLSTIWEARGEAYTNASARVSLENITSKLGYRKVSDLTPTEIAIIEAFEQVQSFLNKETVKFLPRNISSV
ncbi:hypothetical protein F2Q68_00029010 [Brassica cretica]|uniref:Uncharacterized protein n=1 Tax=Brassica cretica TaxID=69181 RepID=A0A8S9GAW6_BRACR|nr:hypothetical protein F2Q68_00029010 [Brassica cretica]